MVICLKRGADLHVAQLMPLPLTVSCVSKIQIGFTFLVPAHPGSPGQRPLNECACVCVCVCVYGRVSIEFESTGDRQWRSDGVGRMGKVQAAECRGSRVPGKFKKIIFPLQ